MMRLALRNLIAEWGIAAMTNPAAAPPLRALAAFAAAADTSGAAVNLSQDHVERLLHVENVFERCADGIRLGDDYLANLDGLRWRAAQFVEAVERSPCGPAPFSWEEYETLPGPNAAEPGEKVLDWTLCAAAVLFNLRLYFEVHEILEPCWLRARGELKTFLQGLIQVAVGFQHHSNGNLRGAQSLLTSGTDKLLPLRPAAWGVELQSFCAAVAECIQQVARQKESAPRSLSELPCFVLHGRPP